MRREGQKSKSVPTGRKRRLWFRVLGIEFWIDAIERVEMINIATNRKLDPRKWHLGNGAVRTPHGFTPRYFEIRADTGERITQYAGLINTREKRQ